MLDVATERLGRAWGAVSHLHAVADSPELRAAYTEALPRVTEFWTRLGADERLYAKYKAMNPALLNAEQRQAHHNAMRNFVLSGAELTGAAKERFAAIQERQAELSQKFSENVLDATDQWSLLVSPTEMAGVPEDVCKATQAAAQAQGEKLGGTSIKLSQKAGVDGRLFGSVTNFDIAEELNKNGYEVVKSQIRMPTGPIKLVGDSTVSVALHTDVVVDITVSVYGETA